MVQDHVIKVSKKILAEMTTVYQPNRLNKTAPHVVFVTRVGIITIIAYQSGKVMFQEPQAEKEAACWEGASTTPQKEISAQTTALPADFGNWSVAGSDEIGSGSYFSSVTVCAVYVNKSIISKLEALGARDSKELTDSQITRLSHVIRELIPYKLLIIEPKKYNEVQLSYSAVHMRVALHNQVICLLLQELAPTKPEGILIDQFIPESNYRKYIRNEKNQVIEGLFFVARGEQYRVAVAAASVISHAAFLEELDKESAGLGFSVPPGAGSKSDQIAARILKKGSLDLSADYTRLRFANTQKA